MLQRLDWLEGIQAQQGEDTEHIQEKALSISGFRFGEAWRQRRLDIIELGLFGGRGEFEQAGFEVFDVGFVEAIIFGREEDCPFPEVLGALVARETGRNRIAFANVEGGKAAVIGIANEDVDASFLELRALGRLFEVGPFKVDSDPCPIGFFDDAQAIGIASGQEDFDGERSLMEVRHACRSSRSGYRMILGSRSTVSKSRSGVRGQRVRKLQKDRGFTQTTSPRTPQPLIFHHPPTTAESSLSHSASFPFPPRSPRHPSAIPETPNRHRLIAGLLTAFS